MGSHKLTGQAQGLHGSALGPLLLLWLLAWCFCGISACGSCVTLTFSSVLGNPFVLLGCLVYIWGEGFFCLILLYFVLLCLVVP